MGRLIVSDVQAKYLAGLSLTEEEKELLQTELGVNADIAETDDAVAQVATEAQGLRADLTSLEEEVGTLRDWLTQLVPLVYTNAEGEAYSPGGNTVYATPQRLEDFKY